MATLSQMQTDLAAAEAALRALYTGVNFSTGGKGGGSLSVTVSAQMAELRAEITRLKLCIAASGGTLTGANMERQGIDVDRSTDNGDGP